MKIKLRFVGGAMLTVATVAVLGSCTSDMDSPGLEYMPDMYRSAAIEPYVDYGQLRGRLDEKVAMEQSALTPPNGTIPYCGTNESDVSIMMPWSIQPNIAFKQTHGLKGYDFTTEDTYNTKAAALTTNPLALTGDDGKETLAEGKKLYMANCVQCHGEKGDGKGQMMQNGTFAGVPNYGDKKALSDGQIFYSIYYGKGAMGSHASQLNKKEIWTLVHYVRKFQDKNYGKGGGEVAPVLDGEEAQTEVDGAEHNEAHTEAAPHNEEH